MINIYARLVAHKHIIERLFAKLSSSAKEPLSFQLGKRISVVGGGGKSTLARAISFKFRYKYIELDAINWLPGWVQREPREVSLLIRKAIDEAGETWVVDGNYFSKVGGFILGRADTIIFVNMPWHVMMKRVFFRSIRRAREKQRICGNNYETFGHTFMSKSSLLLWLIMNRQSYNSRREKIIRWKPSYVPLVELSSAKELNEFYAAQNLHRDIL